jgi:hypothetical protein
VSHETYTGVREGRVGVVVAERSAEEVQAGLAAAYADTGLRIEELWLAYFALGGSAGRYEAEAYLAGLMRMIAAEHNILAQAVNERLAELPSSLRAPYRDP